MQAEVSDPNPLMIHDMRAHVPIPQVRTGPDYRGGDRMKLFQRSDCMHHDCVTGESWITDKGAWWSRRHKKLQWALECGECGKLWLREFGEVNSSRVEGE